MNTEFWWFPKAEPNRTALVCPGLGDVTYADLDARVRDWQARLVDMAQGQPAMAALEFTSDVDTIAAYVALLRAEIPVLLGEPGQMHPDSALLRAWTPELVIKTGANGVTVERTGLGGDLPAPHDDLRVLLSTSGTTGDPKLVRLSAGNIDSNANSIAEYLSLTHHDRAATTLPMFYSYGLSVLHAHLAAGASLVLTGASISDQAFWDVARVHGVTSLALVPHQFDLLDHTGFDGSALPSLRYITQAGGKLAPTLVRKFNDMGRKAGWDLFVMYGQTEAAPRIAYVPPDLLDEAPGAIGVPVPGGRLWLLDDKGQEIHGAGQSGELIYQGPNVMMGYALTRADLAKNAEVSALRTGDVAERNEQGLFRIVGRMKRFVKLYGLRLSLDQIEAMLRDKGIAAQAVAVDDALVLLHQNGQQGEAARNAVADAYHVPTDGILAAHLQRLPLLPSGKTDHRALNDLARSVVDSAEASPSTEDSLEQVLMRVTRRSKIAAKDSFVSLGGDSLSYLNMQMVLEERLGHAPKGWETMSLAELQTLKPRASRVHQDRSTVNLDLVLRLVAITLIIGQHASKYNLFGGTWMLLLLMGYSAARFQSRMIVNGQALRLGFNMLYPILPIYFALMLVYGTMRDTVPVSYWALVGNYDVPTSGRLITVFWFVNLYAQIVGLMVLTALIGPARRALERAPFVAVSVALVALLAANIGVAALFGAATGKVATFPVPHIAAWGLMETMPLFLLGWLIYLGDKQPTRVATMVLALSVVGVFTLNDPSLHTMLWMVLTIALLLMNVELSLDKRLAVVLQRVAGATMFIYVTHQIVLHTVFQFGMPDQAELITGWLICFPVGLGAKWVFDRMDPLILWMNKRAKVQDQLSRQPAVQQRIT